MLLVLQVIAVTLVSVAMALALAHALELPGKLRLSEEAYRAVQPIYYPGFTIGGGIGEGLGLLALLALVFLTPTDGAAFWLTLASFIALAAMHGAYWLLTHPVNNFWVKDIGIGKAGSLFFGIGAGRTQAGNAPDWRALRDRWEYSHVVRAVLGLVSQTLLVIAIAL
jgi:Domain of unknown function (DUF1772)